jgi:predicted nucleic acid-binding protein
MIQLNMFESEGETALIAVSVLKEQIDSMRRKLFAKIGEQEKEIEFLSLQIQMLIEEKDGHN